MKMKSKNNWTMRAAVLMFALVLITSSFVGGTFAKYVTSENDWDSARVAKFGVTVTSDGTLFNKTYATDDNTLVTSAAIANSVSSSDDQKLVAPGTKGSLANVSLTGTPEVAVRVTHTPTVTVTGWKIPGTTTGSEDFYFPLVIKVNGTVVDTSTCTDANAVKTAIEDAIKANTNVHEYAPNTNLNTKTDDALKIDWEWKFHENDEKDKKDTALGNKAADGVESLIKIDITTTVTQID